MPKRPNIHNAKTILTDLKLRILNEPEMDVRLAVDILRKFVAVEANMYASDYDGDVQRH